MINAKYKRPVHTGRFFVLGISNYLLALSGKLANNLYRYILVLYLFFLSITVHAVSYDSCTRVSGMHVTAVGKGSAILKWDAAPSDVVGYQYVINTQQVPPDKYGLFTKDTVHRAKGLAAGATYYAHVRTACQGAQSSDWVTVQFNTPAPSRPDDFSDKVFAVTVYPSQTDRSVTVKAKGVLRDTASVRLFDMRGITIREYTLTGDRLNIEVGSLHPSIYYIRYLDDYGRMQILRFTKTPTYRKNILLE